MRIKKLKWLKVRSLIKNFKIKKDFGEIQFEILFINTFYK